MKILNKFAIIIALAMTTSSIFAQTNISNNIIVIPLTDSDAKKLVDLNKQKEDIINQLNKFTDEIYRKYLKNLAKNNVCLSPCNTYFMNGDFNFSYSWSFSLDFKYLVYNTINNRTLTPFNGVPAYVNNNNIPTPAQEYTFK